MDRRTLLSSVGVYATALLAGCTGQGGDDADSGDDGTEDGGGGGNRSNDGSDDGGGSDDGDGGGGDGTPSHSPDPETPRLLDVSLAVLDVACGSAFGDSETTIADGVVTVEGTAMGNDGCYTARLADARYDADADELRVIVETFSDADGTDACRQCLVEIDYRATVRFEGGEPGNVRVEHR